MKARASNGQSRMAELLETLALKEGVCQTAYLDSVSVGRCNQRRTKGPVLFSLSIENFAQNHRSCASRI
jgi:hypothetical protein